MTSWKPKHHSNDLMILKRNRADHGFFQIETMSLAIRLFRGAWSQPFQRYLFQKRAAVALLPYDPHTDEVVLIEQFRVGALADPQSPWLLELVAGIMDPDENDPTLTAHRETEEETGLKLTHIEPIQAYWASPGISNERIHLFCGHVDSHQAQGIHGVVAEGEDILVHRIPFSEACLMLQQGALSNAPTIIALQWLKLNHTSVKKKWLQRTDKLS